MAIPVSPDIERLYIRLATEPRNRGWSVAKIHEEVNLVIEASNGSLKSPSLPWAYKFVAEIRRTRNEPGWFDEPWSLGALSEPLVDIPNDAIPDITEVWKQCMIGGTTLTIRQAVWIARTRHQIPELEIPERTADLRYLVASLYADEEMRAQIGDRPFDTTYLDGVLVYGLPAGIDTRDGHIYRYVRSLLGDLGSLPKEGLTVVEDLPEDETLAFIEMMERTSIYSPQADPPFARFLIEVEEEWRAENPEEAELFSPILRQAIALGLRLALQNNGSEYMSRELFRDLTVALFTDDSETFKKLVGKD